MDFEMVDDNDLPGTLLMIRNQRGEIAAQVNRDGSWSVDWKLVWEIKYEPSILETDYLSQALISVLLAAKDNFILTSFEQAKVIND